MCGVCGIYSTTFREGSERDISRMVNCMKHRGPDDAGWITLAGSRGEQVSIGNTRLSVIDTSPLGHQPMSAWDGRTWIAYNGEIYNFQEIRKRLSKKGCTFTSGTDTEVLLSAYREWGMGALDILNGMFAFAIWDAGEGELIIGRDRMGIKPLYYAHKNGTVAFASEIKALVSTDIVGSDIDPAGLADFLAYQYIPTPRTMFRDIRKLEPGTFLSVRGGRIAQHSYWSLREADRPVRTLPSEVYEEGLDLLLTDAVRKRLISDVPLGAFLSGGVDSSLIVGIMAKLAGAKIKTFSMGFLSEGEEPYNEIAYARRVAEHFGTDHYEYIARPVDIQHEIEKIAYHFDEPFGGGLHTFFLSLLARRHVTVVLSGLGGDELFAGYEWNRLAKMVSAYGRIPSWLRSHVIDRIHALFPSRPLAGGLMQKLKKASRFERMNPGDRYPFWISVFEPDRIDDVLNKNYALAVGAHDPLTAFRSAWDSAPAGSDQERLLYQQIRTTMLDDFLNYTDKMTMAHSLECRVPFLDHRLVEFAMGVPFELKMKRLTGKHILKRYARRFLPDEVVDRPKQGFIMPLDIWMRGPLKTLIMDHLHGERARNWDVLNMEYVQKLTRAFFDEGEPLGRHIWSLFTFSLWRNAFFEHLPAGKSSGDIHGEIYQNRTN